MADLNDPNYREIYKIYEDGKHRRYTLLFAVNGAAAAITGIIQKVGSDFKEIAFLLVAITIVLCFDISVFGQRIRLVAGDQESGPWTGIFSLYGKVALGVTGALLAVGWLAAAGVINPF
jgi:hypothetical protein